MKNRKRRLLCGVLCAVMLFASTGSVLAVSCTNYSDWFKPSYNEMNELNLIPSEFAGYDLKKNITRGEMSVLAVHAYGLITKNAIELERTDYFSDTTDKTILEAYELGIVSGYPDGTFRPDQYLTRQEFFKIIQNFCNAVAYHPSVDGANLSKFNDSGSLSSWALEAAKICVKCEYVNGTKTASGLSLNPAANTSRQEAMAMFLRCFKGLRQYYYEVVLSATVVIDEEDYDPNVTVTDFSATRYVTASTLNVRDSWSSGSTKVGTLSFGAKVAVTGKCSNGWVRIQYDGHVAYVSGKYLTEQQPASGSTPVTPSTGGSGAAAEIAEFVMSFVGYSYVYGGSKPSTGFDVLLSDAVRLLDEPCRKRPDVSGHRRFARAADRRRPRVLRLQRLCKPRRYVHRQRQLRSRLLAVHRRPCELAERDLLQHPLHRRAPHHHGLSV